MMAQNSPSDNPNMDEYRLMYQNMITENLSQFDTMKEELLQLKEAAINELIAAKDERKEIERNASQIAKDKFDKDYSQLKKALEESLTFELIKKLIEANCSDLDICNWLNENIDHVVKAKIELGFKTFEDQFARVYYSGQGRGGIIHFQLSNRIINFHWEFGGKNALALIFIPEEAQWKKSTGFELIKRRLILEFVANEVILNKANGYSYKIEKDIITIMKP